VKCPELEMFNMKEESMSNIVVIDEVKFNDDKNDLNLHIQ
tara:strand:+ start:286 stop:405 length:120 start_codon:yes stop_codon:yes gene_type:complete